MSQQESVHNDSFLHSKHIQIERSSFLANHYSQKAFHLRQSFNPKDQHGSRLSRYWTPGDSIWTVSLKKMKHNFIKIMNPDTYSKQNMRNVGQMMVKYKVQFVSLVIIIGIPYLIIYPILRPRILKARRQFLFQYYRQTQMLSKKLGATSRVVPVHEIEKKISKQQGQIKL